MPSYRIHAVYRRSPVNPEICYWHYDRSPKKTLIQEPCTFIIGEQESWEWQRKFQVGPVDFVLYHVVQRPGGRIWDLERAIKFYHKPSAVLFKLSRI